jgi:basic membrane protein A
VTWFGDGAPGAVTDRARRGHRIGSSQHWRESMRKRLLLLLAVLASLSLVAAACGDDSGPSTSTSGSSTSQCPKQKVAGDSSGLKVGLLFDLTGRGDQSFNDSAACGLDRAATEFKINPSESEPTSDADRAERLNLLASQGNQLIIGVGFLWADPLTAGAKTYPNTKFGIIDSVVTQPNVVSLTFAEQEGSYLVGAIAALTSKTGKVGFIGGVQNSLIKKFEAGYVAGAKAAKSNINVQVQYITPDGDFTGFTSPDRAKEIATSMYGNGIDVIYGAAGQSGGGMFAAAQEYSSTAGSKVWGIGVDSDQYNTVAPELRDYVLTSMLKRVDVAVYDTVKSFTDGSLQTGGSQVYDLKREGVGYSTTGNFISSDAKSKADDFKQQIIEGKIQVPTSPSS